MSKTVLIAGASGLVGAASVDAFLEDGWNVIAVSRRKPEITSMRPFQHLPLNLADADEVRSTVSDLSTDLARVTHVVYSAVYEKPGLIAGWSDPEQMSTNLQMLRNLIDPLSEVADLKHVTLLQGTKAYGIHLHPMPVPARERFPRDDHQNFYWLQEDYIKEQSAKQGFDFTIFRPQLIVGPAIGVAMNLPPVIGAYAAICKEEGRPFSFPGGASYVWEAVDVRLVANAILWAAEAPAAAGEHFNLTNGEVFAWRDLWPAFAEELGVEVGPDEPLSLAEYLPAKADVWDKVVANHGLRPNRIQDIVGESHYYADFCMAYGAEEPPPPAFVSTVKIKQAGFTQTWDTEQSFRHWLRVLIDRRILPTPR
jgi:nucleoside-diphosphate-sugar epimerase